MKSAIERRAPNGIHYRVEGEGEPLLLLHGLLVSGSMFDPLIEVLRGRYRMIVPDLRGHGGSGAMPGPYDVVGLASDLPAVLDDAGIAACMVMGYSHGGAVAQQLAHQNPERVSKLILCCTYACIVATPREKIEARILQALTYLLSPQALSKIAVRGGADVPDGSNQMKPDEIFWLRNLIGQNRSSALRGSVRGLRTFDSRPWLGAIAQPTLVIAGAADGVVPRRHYDELSEGIQGAEAHRIDRADHTLVWTHTRQLADLIESA